MKGKNLWIALKKNVRNGLDWICIEVVYKKCLAMSPTLHPNVTFITPFSYAMPDETKPVDEPLEISADEPIAEPEQEEIPEVLPVETDEPQEETPETPEEPAHDAAGSYVNVTTQTRVFASMDSEAVKTYYSGEYLGNFVKDATVQILSVDFDETGNVWYQVRFLYGDDFADGRFKWTDYATAWILPDETFESSDDSCTVTDFAYTVEFLNMNRSSGRKLLKAATPMNGFTLKNINGAVGGFYAWQNGLYGSSGKDSDYPQLAKSAAHGTIYATPHYLEGFTVFCLEHNLSGPGEGSGSNQSAKGPYLLLIDDEGKMRSGEIPINCIASDLYASDQHGDPIVGNTRAVRGSQHHQHAFRLLKSVHLAQQLGHNPVHHGGASAALAGQGFKFIEKNHSVPAFPRRVK